MPIQKTKSEDNVVTYSVLDREISNSDFLGDPDLYRDILPQPFRRIDKILQTLLEEAWTKIEKNENERTIEQNKHRAQVFNTSTILDLPNVNCICLSSDDYNDYVFAGSMGFIYAIDSGNLQTIDKFDLSKIETDTSTNITKIYSSQLKSSVYLIVSITDSGFLFMHIFMKEKFYFVQSLSQESDTERKFLYKKCQITKNSDYIAVFIEMKSNLSDCLIEIHKCPKELWFQSLESIEHKRDESEVGNEPAPLAKPNLFCKIKPPANQFRFQSSNHQNLTQVLKQAEHSQDIIGTGLNSIFNKTFIDLKCQLAEKCFALKLTEESMNQINGNRNFDFTGNKVKADFIFLPSNKLIWSGNTDLNDNVTSIAVCWNNSNQICLYPLGRVSKELESKCECILPFSSQISHFQTSKCNNLLAVSLKDNNIVVFDLNMGIERTCVHIADSEIIRQVHFMPKSVPSSSFLIENSVVFKIESELVCLTNLGNLYSIDCGLNSKKIPRHLFKPQLANKDDKLTFVKPIYCYPNLLMAISETNKLYLFGMDKSQLLCELDQSELTVELDNINLDFSLKCHNLFLNGKLNENGRLINHCVKSVGNLDGYFNMMAPIMADCLPINAHLDDRVKILLKNKSDEHQERRNRLKNVWNELSELRNYSKHNH